MAVKLICASHSPLMEFASPQEKRKEQAVRDAFEKLSAEVKAYDPTLIIFVPKLRVTGIMVKTMITLMYLKTKH